MQSFILRSTAIIAACAFSFALIGPLAAAAQDDPDAAPPSSTADGVGVARISAIDGKLALQRGDSSDSLDAAVNAPVLGGDYVVSGEGSRGEIQIDGYAALRVADDVQLRFTHLDPTERSIQLAAGTVELRLLRGADGTTNIDTPSITIKPLTAGTYRVTVTPDGQTLVTVRSGDAQIVTPQAPIDLQPGTTLVARGEAANPSTQTQAAIAPDAFDDFNRERDRLYLAARTDAQYVDPQIGGVEDLNANGRWVDDGTYGNVWVPMAVAPDWAPYRDGRWVWEDGYGWTWIGYESWGWAPYHYGSWYNSPTYGWCWYPPRPHAFVAWRPALVAFIGFGVGAAAGVSLGFAGGNAFANIGWVPLAPFEPYHPWWGNRYGRGYGGTTIVNNINVTNVTNVTNINVYRNVQYNAVTSVSSERFIQGNFSHNAAVPAPELATAHVFAGAVPVMPTAANLRFSRSAAPSELAVRAELTQRPFAGNRSVVNRTPFTAQRVALATATHAAVTPLHYRDAQTTPITFDRASAAGAPATAHAAPGAQGGAWDRFNSARSPNGAPAEAGHSSAASGSDRPSAPVGAYHESTTNHAPPAGYHEPVHNDTQHMPEIIDGASSVRSANGQTGNAHAEHVDAPAQRNATYDSQHRNTTGDSDHRNPSYAAPHRTATDESAPRSTSAEMHAPPVHEHHAAPPPAAKKSDKTDASHDHEDASHPHLP